MDKAIFKGIIYYRNERMTKFDGEISIKPLDKTSLQLDLKKFYEEATRVNIKLFKTMEGKCYCPSCNELIEVYLV
jgi:hypothetical protein